MAVFPLSSPWNLHFFRTLSRFSPPKPSLFLSPSSFSRFGCLWLIEQPFHGCYNRYLEKDGDTYLCKIQKWQDSFSFGVTGVLCCKKRASLRGLQLLCNFGQCSFPYGCFYQTSAQCRSHCASFDLVALPVETNGYIRVDCYGGLNQMRRDLCDGMGIARLLNATLVLPKFEVAAYWNETSGFADIFDVDYFIQQMEGFVKILKELPEEIASQEPVHVDCSKRKGHFDYVEAVLPSLIKHHFISITPAMSQRRDRYPFFAKAALCQGCYNALRLTNALERKGSELLNALPKPLLSLHLRFEPDMVAYSQCEYPGLSPASIEAINSARGDRKPWTGEAARVWRNRGKCPLTPNETAFILQALAIPTDTAIYLAAGDGILEIEGLTEIYTNVYTKSSLLSKEDFENMHGNTKAALDYYVSINSDAYIATFFGNMDKMVAAMRPLRGLFKTLFLNRRAFADFASKGLKGEELVEALWRTHADEFIMGRGSALPDCFCELKLQ